MKPLEIRSACDSIAENLHGVRQALDELAFIIDDLSRTEPVFCVQEHIRHAFKATATALMSLHEAEANALHIGCSQVAVVHSAEAAE